MLFLSNFSIFCNFLKSFLLQLEATSESSEKEDSGGGTAEGGTSAEEKSARSDNGGESSSRRSPSTSRIRADGYVRLWTGAAVAATADDSEWEICLVVVSVWHESGYPYFAIIDIRKLYWNEEGGQEKDCIYYI